ncbi:hypothetical protein CK231_01330 [Mesorhizobium loti]|uniref:Uncharacterized protein n=1 Tax=Rhizobium loti TaxID=381 RepID=A0A1A5I4E4_RHILI|nr:hypothetical protein BAE39_17000 [Mesorhizobium loti]QGX77297.1 hypothetical protein EB234_10505 [Mesorhizobium japonicum R7A]OBP80450.1 hypothetical protein BAE42_02035 [Mesorhizobium loti]OBP84986.1 hypothetical protein BAE38_21895 [Mesorhizobium loti]OBP91783.1 hypothetical protein BAE41_01555 [Mesorhizobium loti]
MMIFRFLVHSLCRADGRGATPPGKLLSFWRAINQHMVLVAASMKPEALLLKPIICDLAPHLGG